MEEMKTIYQVEGKLCKDFIGQISYTVCLDQTYGELDIEFSFGSRFKRRRAGASRNTCQYRILKAGDRKHHQLNQRTGQPDYE